MEKLILKLNKVCVGVRDPKCRRIPHSSNARMHWGARARWNAAWKDEVRIAFLPHRLKFPARSLPLERPQITFTVYAVQLLDQDNLRQACKPLLDALKERGGIGLIRDDGPEFIPEPAYSQVQVKHLTEEHVEIVVEAAPSAL